MELQIGNYACNCNSGTLSLLVTSPILQVDDSIQRLVRCPVQCKLGGVYRPMASWLPAVSLYRTPCSILPGGR